MKIYIVINYGLQFHKALVEERKNCPKHFPKEATLVLCILSPKRL